MADGLEDLKLLVFGPEPKFTKISLEDQKVDRAAQLDRDKYPSRPDVVQNLSNLVIKPVLLYRLRISCTLEIIKLQPNFVLFV